MSLKELTLQEMASITAGWADANSPARAVLTGNPVLRALVPQVDTVNARLIAARKVDPTLVASLTDLATAADAEHDFWVEAIVNVCDAAHPTQPDLGFSDLRQWLFPRGLMHARDSYGTEVGYAMQKSSELDSARKKQLKAIPIGGQTLLQWVDNYFHAAQKLGDIERQRSEASAGGSSDDALASRRAFQALVRALDASAKIAGLSDEDYNTLFSYMNELSARKTATKKKAVNPQPAPGPAPTPTPPVPAPTPNPAPTPVNKAGEDKK
jgi:hypothetical protein